MTTPVEAATERHRAITDRLEAVGRVQVGELAVRLDVAPETIRRDLRMLEQQGLLQRVHGGAVRRADHPLSPFDGHTPEHPEHHRRLAELVAAQLPTNATIFLGASPLVAAVAEALTRQGPVHGALTVVTSSLDVAVVLSRVERLSVFNLGGTVDQVDRSQSGDWALSELGRLRADVAVLGADGLTPDHGLFSATAMGAALMSTAIGHADRTWVVLEPDQLGRPGFMAAASLDCVERLYIAGRPDVATLAPFQRAGTEIVTGA